MFMQEHVTGRRERRYLAGCPVFEVGEKVEAFSPDFHEWLPALVEARYNMAEMVTGKRNYAYGLRFDPDPRIVGFEWIQLPADALRLPRRVPRVLRANKVKR